ncbi:hypothetical protein PSCICO_16600 [Pseudomonas cichorii]|nr:hypothetical protein PSCICO_16600 [Pseudomonas cichorii]
MDFVLTVIDIDGSSLNDTGRESQKAASQQVREAGSTHGNTFVAETVVSERHEENGGHYFISRRQDQKSFAHEAVSHPWLFLKPFVTDRTLNHFINADPQGCHATMCRKGMDT